MFKITDFHRAGDMIRMVIETDDPSSALFFRFFSDIQKFIDLYHFLLRSASQIDLYQKNKPARMAQLKCFRTEQLETFRKLKGTRIERFRLIKVLRESNGDKVTLGRIMAEIKIALDEERGGPQGLDRFETNLRCTVLGVMPPPGGRREPENRHRCFDSMPRRAFGRKDSNADAARCRT